MFSCSKKSSIGLGGMLGSVMQDEDKVNSFTIINIISGLLVYNMLRTKQFTIGKYLLIIISLYILVY